MANFLWKPVNLSIRQYSLLEEKHRNISYKQIINHFQDNRSICTKPGLVRTLKEYYRNLESALEYRYTVFETMATTFVLTAGSEDAQHYAFEKRFKQIALGNFSRQHVPSKHCKQNFWLIKPANMNQGRGIEIF